MPNYCYNEITINRTTCECCSVKGEEGYEGDEPEQINFYGVKDVPPNLCIYECDQADMYSSGEKLSWDELVRRIKKGGGFMSQTCPIEGEPDCDLQEETWGTKWDFGGDVSVVIDDEKIVIEGDTAWSPPKKWVDFIETNYDVHSIQLLFKESGMGFGGVYQTADGETDISFDWSGQLDDSVLNDIHQKCVVDLPRARASSRTPEFSLALLMMARITEIFVKDLREEIGDYYEEDVYDFFIPDYLAMQEYERWEDDVKDEFVSRLKEKMERLEELELALESGEINEGKYLEECNKLV